MITFINKGRCGNFLFQAATAYGYARKHGMGPEDYTVPSTTNNQVWNPLYLPHLINPRYDPSLPKATLVEKTHEYHDIVYSPIFHKQNVFLDGYWQSYKYFDAYRSEILRLFLIPYHYDSGAVAIHVRRGDYLLYPRINPLATRDYYEQAVRSFWLQGYKKFTVFSDDIPWCIQEFKHGVYQGCEFSFSQGQSVIADLSRMSACEHAIMSNSTFGWWGAWLNQNPNKIVVCPHEDNYYGPENKHLDVSTLYPPEWVRIKY